jgi:hypothetical protein
MKQFLLVFTLLPCAQGFLVHGPSLRATTRSVRMMSDDDSKAMQQLAELITTGFNDLGSRIDANNDKIDSLDSMIDKMDDLVDKVVANKNYGAGKLTGLATTLTCLDSKVDNLKNDMHDKIKEESVLLTNEINGISKAAVWSSVLTLVLLGFATVFSSPTLAEHTIPLAEGEFQSDSAWLLTAVVGLLLSKTTSISNET